MIKKVFIWTSPLPLLTLWLISIYLKQFEGWGRAAGAILFMGPVILSMVMAMIGAVLIIQARKQRAPVGNLWFSTLMAGSLFLYFLVMITVQELVKSFG
jgi:hypothetical protein